MPDCVFESQARQVQRSHSAAQASRRIEPKRRFESTSDLFSGHSFLSSGFAIGGKGKASELRGNGRQVPLSAPGSLRVASGSLQPLKLACRGSPIPSDLKNPIACVPVQDPLDT